MQTDHMAWPSPAAESALLDPVCGMQMRMSRVSAEAGCEKVHKASPRKRDERAATAIKTSGQTLSAA